MKKSNIAIIIPAHNEELVIEKTLEALIKEINGKHVYLVDDGSKDRTAQMALKYLPKNRVLSIKNGGKARAITTAIEKFNLTNKYNYLMIHDADTRMQTNFLNKILEVFENDVNKEIACVMGQVVADDYNWLTAYRIWEYSIGQLVHKQAQSRLNAITVSPGCSSVYRSEIFVNTKIPTNTLTEDMDLTFEIHRKNLGKLVYQPHAKMLTQDPKSIRDYYKQIQRWYGGFWQCVFKHQIPWGGQKLDWEVAMMGIEGLIQPFILIISLMLISKSYLNQEVNQSLFLFLFMDIFIFVLPTIIIASLISKKWKILLYLPHFYFIRSFSGLVFLYTFLRESFRFGTKMKFGWSTARYEIAQMDTQQQHISKPSII